MSEISELEHELLRVFKKWCLLDYNFISGFMKKQTNSSTSHKSFSLAAVQSFLISCYGNKRADLFSISPVTPDWILMSAILQSSCLSAPSCCLDMNKKCVREKASVLKTIIYSNQQAIPRHKLRLELDYENGRGISLLPSTC